MLFYFEQLPQTPNWSINKFMTVENWLYIEDKLRPLYSQAVEKTKFDVEDGSIIVSAQCINASDARHIANAIFTMMPSDKRFTNFFVRVTVEVSAKFRGFHLKSKKTPKQVRFSDNPSTSDAANQASSLIEQANPINIGPSTSMAHNQASVSITISDDENIGKWNQHTVPFISTNDQSISDDEEDESVGKLNIVSSKPTANLSTNDQSICTKPTATNLSTIEETESAMESISDEEDGNLKNWNIVCTKPTTTNLSTIEEMERAMESIKNATHMSSKNPHMAPTRIR